MIDRLMQALRLQRMSARRNGTEYVLIDANTEIEAATWESSDVFLTAEDAEQERLRRTNPNAWTIVEIESFEMPDPRYA